MGLYNMVFGENNHSDVILAMAGLTKRMVGRYRDVHVSEGKIAVYTRNGGGNRECWQDDELGIANSAACDCVGCIMTYCIPKLPNYLSDKDDDFDSTYATIWFSVPDEFKEMAAAFESGVWKPEEKWQKAIEALKAQQTQDVRRESD